MVGKKRTGRVAAVALSGILMAAVPLVGCFQGDGADDKSSEHGSDKAEKKPAEEEPEEILKEADAIQEAVDESGIHGLSVPDSFVVGTETFTTPSDIEYEDGIVIVSYQSDAISVTITKSNDGLVDELPDDDGGEGEEADGGSQADGADGQADAVTETADGELTWRIQSGGRTYVCSGREQGHPEYVTWDDPTTGSLYSVLCFSTDDGSSVLTDAEARTLADSVS